MANTVVSFLSPCNGDMTLVSLADSAETKILIDCNIRDCTPDEDGNAPRDVGQDLRDRLKRDAKGRPYVDAYLLSHPDQDHCRGLAQHFHLGRPEDYPDDDEPDELKKILIREIWSSPMVFRRASATHVLCEDAKAFNSEAKRRATLNREKAFAGIGDGNRILILGEDEDGKTDDLEPILVRVDEVFSQVNGAYNPYITVRLLAPLPKEDEESEGVLSKNHSSTILNLQLTGDLLQPSPCQFLTGGDAEVAIWERLWQRHKGLPSVLEYDLLLSPHHCSWHCLSYDSWSEKREKGQVSADARAALGQIRANGVIVASSAPIVDDDNDPPCIGAKREYEKMTTRARGQFLCTGEHPTESAPEPLEFIIDRDGLRERTPARRASKSTLRPAVIAPALSFPNKPVVPNKPAGFA